jgi:ribosomal protein S18 acetylase RimI-like enzyme
MAETLQLRGLTSSDREPIERLLAATGFFSESELAVALQVVDEGLGAQGDDPYMFVVAEHDGELAGYACFGSVPGSRADWDLYWIAVDARLQGRGIGRELLRAAVEQARAAGAARVLIETASKPLYAPTREFYERAGAELIGRQPDHYATGDDKLVYAIRTR